ncbi:MAG: AAA family ATPase, partial [Burkholderiales bacterium]|nr:AAA family ATPase [Burkholderiales bacterium]
MRLTSIRIEQFRQFRQPLRIDGLESGLNLFAGPNETGKSTVVTAIRAAFFERHRSSSVDDLRPWDDGSASPTVELEFVLNDQPCRLMKSFLGKKRCELQIGTQRFEGTDAEDRLAALLGFQYAGRGASGAEHWGIPGLLWIQQGAAQDIGDPVRHATDHLRTALNESLGEVASSGGDDVLAAVEAQRNELLTPAAGAPRGPYLEARNQVARLAGSLEELDATIEAYRQKVDALAELRREQARDEVDQPWLVFRKQEQASAQHLETVQRVERDLQTDRSRLSELERQLAQWRERLDGFDAQERDLNQRTVDREAARQAAQSADVTVQQWKTQCAAATGRHDAARATARVARLEAGRSGLAQQLEILRQKADAIRAKQTQVEAERLRLLDLETQAAASEIAADDLDALRTQHRLLHDAGIRLDGAATRLRFTLDPGCSALLGEDMVSGSGERQLTVPTTIAVPGFGWFEIMPGGTDLADLARDAATLRDTHFALLQRLGLPTFEAAEARHRNHDRLMRDIKASTAMLQALAPEGLDSLRSERHVTDAKIHELEQTLAQLPAPADGVPHPAAVSEAEAAEEEARRSLDRLTAELNRAQLTAADARSAEAAALREWAAARATIDAPERAGQRARIQQALIDARADQAALTVMIENRERQVTEAR